MYFTLMALIYSLIWRVKINRNVVRARLIHEPLYCVMKDSTGGGLFMIPPVCNEWLQLLNREQRIHL